MLFGLTASRLHAARTIIGWVLLPGRSCAPPGAAALTFKRSCNVGSCGRNRPDGGGGVADAALKVGR